MSRVIAVANQKGGVAKTTSVVSLGAAFAQHGLRVLLVDLDPQSSLTFSLGIDPDAVETSVADVLIGESDLAATTLTAGEGLRVVPATIDLAGVEAMLLPAEGREYVLRQALEPVLSSYDVILLDCSPSLGLLTLNALAAADGVLIPLQSEYLALEGLVQLRQTIDLVVDHINRKLRVFGIVLTMYDTRTNLSAQVQQEVRTHFARELFETVIPRSIRLSEAPSFGQTISEYDPTSRGAVAYAALAREVVARSDGGSAPAAP
jgi:chromosome partitioning protein